MPRPPRAAALLGGALALCLWAPELSSGLRRAAGGDGAHCAHPEHVTGTRAGSRVVRCAGEPSGAPPRGAAVLLFGDRLELNGAPAAALEALPGIGPSRAGALVAARCRSPFRTLHDAREAHGVGPATLEGIAPFVRVDPGTPAAGCGATVRRGRESGA